MNAVTRLVDYVLFRKADPIATPAGLAPVVARQGDQAIASTVGVQALTLDRTSNEMLRQYYRSIYVWRCVDLIAQMASSVELDVEPRTTRELNPKEQQIQDLLEQPNPQWTRAALQYFVAASLAVANKAFLLRVRGMSGATLELWPINANEIMTKYYTGTKVISSFQWTNPLSGARLDYPVAEDGDCDIVYVHRPALNFQSDRSPAAIAQAPAEVFTRILQRCADIVSNTSNISGVLSTEAELVPKQVQDVKDRLNQYRTGGPESGGVLVTASAKWGLTRLSEDPAVAMDVRIKDALARDIAITFGVPTQLVGLPGQDTYNNLQMARVGFMNDTVLPGYIGLYIAALNATLMRDLDADIEPDIDGIPTMAQARLLNVQTAKEATMLSINEQRELLGYPPFEDEMADKPVLLEDLQRKRLEVELKYPMADASPT